MLFLVARVMTIFTLLVCVGSLILALVLVGSEMAREGIRSSALDALIVVPAVLIVSFVGLTSGFAGVFFKGEKVILLAPARIRRVRRLDVERFHVRGRRVFIELNDGRHFRVWGFLSRFLWVDFQGELETAVSELNAKLVR